MIQRGFSWQTLESLLTVINSTSKTDGVNSLNGSSDTDIVTTNEELDVDKNRQAIRVGSRKTSEHALPHYSAETGSHSRMRSTLRTSSWLPEDKWQITRILSKRLTNRKGKVRKRWEYQMEWAISWVPGHKLRNTREIVQEFKSKV